MTVEELIKKEATINYRNNKPYKLIEIYREKFVLIRNGIDERVIDKETVLDYWSVEEKKRIELEQAKNGTSAIEKYFELYGPLNKTEHFDQNKDKYPSEYASKGFNSTIMNKVKPTPNSMFGWNAEIYFLHLNTCHRKNTNNYYNKAGVVTKISLDLTTSYEWCIDCKIVNDKPKIRHSHHWYDEMETEWVTKYEGWENDLKYAFDLFWQYCLEEFQKHFDLEKPILKQRDWLYQEGSKFIFDLGTLRLHACEILSNGKIRNASLSTSPFPKAFKNTITIDEIKNEFLKQYNLIKENPRSRY